MRRFRNMTYGQRMRLALVCSLVIHLAVLMPPGCRPNHDTVLALNGEPLVLNIEPQPEPMRRLIDTLRPADQPPADTDLISDAHSKASDNADVEGDRIAPHFDRPSDFDELVPPPVAPAPPSAPAAPPAPDPTPDREEESKAEPEPAPTPPDVEPDEQYISPTVEPERDSAKEKRNETTPGEATPDHPESDESALRVAQAPAPDPQELERSKGRDDGAAPNKGVLSFEAKQHELAPYMKEIRSRVESRWRAMLELQYTGAMPTKAVLDCVIAPDGRLVSVEIVDKGDTLTFGPLCERAIAQSAPFAPFPFDVPEIYRSKNLEIRWTFSFL